MPPHDDIHAGCPEVFWRVVRLLERALDDFPQEQFQVPGQVVVVEGGDDGTEDGESDDDTIYTQEEMVYLSDCDSEGFECIDLTCDETDSDDDDDTLM